jgi:raffinose/stachyose/melibiose transport system substrate-binding protein
MNSLVKIVLALLISITVASCSKKQEKSKEIEFLTDRTDLVQGIPDANGNRDASTAIFKVLADKFKKETGITVKLTAVTDYKNFLRRRMASGDYGDVITNDDFPSKTLKQFFQPIGTKEEFKNYRFIDNYSIGDNVYGLAPGYYFLGVVYNKEVFAKAGYDHFPETLSELDDAMAKIKKNGEIPVIINRGTNWPLYFINFVSNEFAGKAGVYNRLWEINDPFSKTQPEGKAIDMVANWVTKDWTEPEFIADWENSKTLVATNKAGMMILESWILPQVISRAESIKGCNPDNIAFAAFPKLDDQKKHYIYANPGKTFLISKKSKNFEAAKKWTLYLVNSGIFDDQGALPIEKGKETKTKQLKNILNQVNDGKLTILEAISPDAFNGNRTNDLFKDMDIFSDLKYFGMPLDAAKKSMKDFNECIAKMNKDFATAKKSRGY